LSVASARLSHFHKQGSPYYWIFVQEHIGLYAPSMPTLRPRYAENPGKKRPLFAEENTVLHRYHRRSAPKMPTRSRRTFGGCLNAGPAPLECRSD
jgi:hypothetical protein